MINFKVDVESLKRELDRELIRLSKKIPLAIARGLNEGGNKVRTQVQHALQRQTGLVKYRSVTSRIETISAAPLNSTIKLSLREGRRFRSRNSA